MDERVRFIAACVDGDDTFTEICRRYGVSRQTGYKWIERYEQHGPVGLLDRPPVAYVHPLQTPTDLVDAIVQLRKQRPFWGPKKLLARLQELEPGRSWPATSTIGELLKRNGLIRPRRRRPRVPSGVTPIERGVTPNDVWCADFKGHFALGDRTRCHPLTLSDECSRYVLKCEALARPKGPPVRAHFELAFREFGLPLGMRTDNGPPFASTAVGGLSELSVWWIQLGIRPLRIDPGEPQQNGVHERMHRTLKQETTHSPGDTQVDQQRVFDRFRREFNDERPHEALAMRPPTRVYTSSPRRLPDRPQQPEYGRDFEVRRCNYAGSVSVRGLNFYLTRLLSYAHVGVRACADARWEVRYGPVLLGHVDDRSGEPRFERA